MKLVLFISRLLHTLSRVVSSISGLAKGQFHCADFEGYEFGASFLAVLSLHDGTELFRYFILGLFIDDITTPMLTVVFRGQPIHQKRFERVLEITIQGVLDSTKVFRVLRITRQLSNCRGMALFDAGNSKQGGARNIQSICQIPFEKNFALIAGIVSQASALKGGTLNGLRFTCVHRAFTKVALECLEIATGVELKVGQ